MAGSSALKWSATAAATTGRYEGQLACPHGETVGHYAPGSVPGTPGQAARRMLLAHQEAYGCACTRAWWAYYAPGGAGWDDADDLDDADDPAGGGAPVAVPSTTPAPRWRYHHLIADADTDRTEKELERLSGAGWEVVTLAIGPGPPPEDAVSFVYLLRQRVSDH